MHEWPPIAFSCIFGACLDFLLARAAEYGTPLDEDLAGTLVNQLVLVEQFVGWDASGGVDTIARQEIVRMFVAIEEALKRFLSSVEPRRLVWFLAADETINAVSFMEPLLPFLQSLGRSPEIRDTRNSR